MWGLGNDGQIKLLKTNWKCIVNENWQHSILDDKLRAYAIKFDLS